ncbi:type II toxin-antitoxin system prevent-host-death family antitoxin [Chloroflexi bacterium TSY]|nr:type II toxin-antitoxin system prevent-host-death family antitoxin [Chloroflexi bacterium TSY]
MNQVPQMASISELRNNHLDIFKRLEKGPVILASRAEPKAVVVSVNEWNDTAQKILKMEQRIARLETYIESKRIAAEMKSNPDSTTSLTELCERYNVVEKPGTI